MNLGPNPSHGTFHRPIPTLNQVQGILQMVRKPFMVSHSQPVPPVGVPSQEVYPNKPTYVLGGQQVLLYGIHQAQCTGVTPVIYGTPVKPQQSIPTQSGYQPQHGYPPQVMGNQPYYGGGALQAPPAYFPQQMSDQQAYVPYALMTNRPHQYALHTQMNRQLPFLATLDLLNLSCLTNDPIFYNPSWPPIPHKLPLDIPKFDGKANE